MKAQPQLKILVLSGPNLDRLGTREPTIYGTATLDDIHRTLAREADALGAKVVCEQTNHEGELITRIGAAEEEGYAGLVLNAGGYTHTSIAILDAIRSAGVPCVEVHLTNLAAREPFRRRSRLAAACLGTVAGFGADSYRLGLSALVHHLAVRRS